MGEARSLSRTGSKASIDSAWMHRAPGTGPLSSTKQYRVPQYHTFSSSSGTAASLFQHRKRRSMFPEWGSSTRSTFGAGVGGTQASAADVRRGRDMSRTASRVASKTGTTSEQQASSSRYAHATHGDRAHLAQEPDLPDVAEVSGIDARIYQEQQASSATPAAGTQFPGSRSSSTSPSRPPTAPSRRVRSRRIKSGVALLACGALFGIYRATLSGRADIRALKVPGNIPSRVPGATRRPVPWDATKGRSDVPDLRHPAILYYASPSPSTDAVSDERHAEPNPPYEHPPPPSWERIVGRISAWICTVLYMTSRLPQIWTNLTRRSVEGLSILLFFSAFMGNLLYTVSILVNPESTGPQARDYLAESIPFLLGSGGTLIFDLIIMAQWFAWKGNSPHPIAYVRRQARRTSSMTMRRSRSRSESMHSPAASHRVALMSQSLPGLPSHPQTGEYGRAPTTPTLQRHISTPKLNFGSGRNFPFQHNSAQGTRSPEGYFRPSSESEDAPLLNEGNQDRGD